MSHAFGDRIRQHLSRKHGLSQNKLAEGIDQDSAVISAMCHGRRLTGAQARERVLAIICWFRDQGVLDQVVEANALLESAGHARLDLASPREAEIAGSLQMATPSDKSDIQDPAEPDAEQRRVNWKAVALAGGILVAIGVLVALGIAALTARRPTSPAWEAAFDPLDPDQWLRAQGSAVWEDIPGPAARLRENHPDQDFGKAESSVIALDVDIYPILQVHVTEIDPDASLTVQILDKRTDTWRDVLPAITYPDEYAVDLRHAMDWQGHQVFTINLWVGGEDRTVTLERLSIECSPDAPVR